MIFRKPFKKLDRLMSREYNPVCGYAELDDKVEVYVQKKLSLEEIGAQVLQEDSPWDIDDLVEKECNGKPTDVIEIGEVVAYNDTKRYRPLKGGIQIQPSGANFVGTLGMIGEAAQYGGFTLIGGLRSFKKLLDRLGIQYNKIPVGITNSHCVNLDVTNPVLNRAVGQPNAGSWIGQVLWSSDIKSSGRNELDASLITIDVNNLPHDVMDVGKIAGYRKVVVGEPVHKRGRTTLYTDGYCRANRARVNIRFGDQVIPFDNCHLFSNMSNSGDSGSVIVAQEDNKVVSLLFAGSPTTTIGCDFSKFVEETGVIIGN